MIKATENSQVKKYTGQRGLGGPEGRSACPCGVGVRHPPAVGVFAHLEDL